MTSTPQSYFVAESADQVPKLLGLGRRKAGGRLVEQQEARIDGERAREADAPFLAIAQARGGPIGLCGKAELVEDFARPPARLGAAEAMRHIARPRHSR